MVEDRLKSQFAQMRPCPVTLVSSVCLFPITPEQSASVGCLVRTSVQQRVIDQVNVASQCLSLPAFLCPRRGICGTIQLSESLFQATIVFWVLNVNVCYRCDWNK